VSSLLYAFWDRQIGLDIEGQLDIVVEAHAKERWMKRSISAGMRSTEIQNAMRNWLKVIGLEDAIWFDQVIVLK
jgi:hypothetical protein